MESAMSVLLPPACEERVADWLKSSLEYRRHKAIVKEWHYWILLNLNEGDVD